MLARRDVDIKPAKYYWFLLLSKTYNQYSHAMNIIISIDVRILGRGTDLCQNERSFRGGGESIKCPQMA